MAQRRPRPAAPARTAALSSAATLSRTVGCPSAAPRTSPTGSTPPPPATSWAGTSPPSPKPAEPPDINGAPVHVGIDLAWNVNARTGIAVVDADGALLSSVSVRADTEIDAWLTPWLPSVTTVAVDAPLVVTNRAGMRDAERAVTRAYGRFHAGCHASNRSMVYMDPPRAWALARRHGWAVDPGHVGRMGAPGCVEVYPHPATIGLFGLERVLKYKKGPVATRRAALLALVRHLESLAVLRLPGHPRWVWVREVVAEATRPVQLDAVEDEVDAVLCAHLAWLWDVDRASLHAYGGTDGGFIVAPPPPPPPPPRVRPPVPPPG